METARYSSGNRRVAVASNEARDTGKDAPRKHVERNTERSISKILLAARSEFAGGGFGGARVDEIAAQAGVSKNLIYHYFGSKEQLYLAVLKHELSSFNAHQDGLHIDMLDPEEAMRRLITHTFDYFARTPELLSLINTENLLQARHFTALTEILSLYDPLMRLRGVIERGVTQGVFRPDVDLMNLYISISSLAWFYLSNRWTLSHLFARDLATPNMLKRRKAHIISLVMAYLNKPSFPHGREGESTVVKT